jgi:hypothetical protein
LRAPDSRLVIAAALVCLWLVSAGSAGAQTKQLYGSDGAGGKLGNLVILDPATGAVTQTVGPVGFSVTGLAEDPSDGVLYGSTGREVDPQGTLITVNKATGAGTLIGALRDGEPAADITFLGGILFGWLEGSSLAEDLVRIDKATGVATTVDDSGLAGTRGSGLAAAPDGTLYYAGSLDNGPLRTIDPDTGAPSDGPTLDGTCGSPIRALAFDPSGTLYGVRRGGGNCLTGTELITIDTDTGHVIAIGETLQVPDLDGIAFADPPTTTQQPPPPPPPPPPTDTDGDGIQDASDACPTTFAQTPNGCPAPLPSPVIGEMVVAAVVSGRVTVALPGRPLRFIPLSEAREIPVGSVVDTRRGTIRLTSARDSAGRAQSGDFSGGLFQVRQSRSRSARGLTDLVLKGGSFRSCGATRGKRASASQSRTVRRLRSNARGRFRTSGRNSSATVRGTRWETIDRCDGTLTKVQRGTVVVRDFRKKKNVFVKAGKSYLARARR